MNNYFDKWGRLHHKPCVDGEPSSNNGWIYTAYYDKLNNGMVIGNLRTCFEGCLRNGSFHRHPPSIQSKVPMSRDEILGAAALGLLKPQHLNGWNFSPFPLPKFDIIKTIQQFLELRDKHRNYLWQNNMIHTYRFAFSMPIQDRAFLLECWGETKSLRYFFYKGIAFLDSKFGKPKNGIPWLKYGGEERKAVMRLEFPEDHPLRKL